MQEPTMAAPACQRLPFGALPAASAQLLGEQTGLPAAAAHARLPHLVEQASASLSAHATCLAVEQRYVHRAANILSSLLGAVGGPPDPAAACPSYQALAAAAQSALLHRQARALYAWRDPAPPPAGPAPASYLAGVAQAAAALNGGGGAATPPAADGVRRVLADERDVGAELAVDPRDPSQCTLRLRPLGPARTQAAIAAKLHPRVAAAQRRLRVRLQCAHVEARARTALLSSERAALLAASMPAPLPHPQLALTAVLRAGRAAAAARQQAPPMSSAPVGRQALNAGVLFQHKQLNKAWAKRRQRETAERLDALKGQDYEEYLRLLRQRRGGSSAKIDTLLSQTDACLRELAGRLRAAGAGRALEATAAAGGSPSLSGSPAAPGGSGSGELGVAALEQSHESWNQLARAFQADDVPEQPAVLTGGALRDYQVKGLRWLVGLHRQGLNGILADEMGLGKTVQVIALACHLAGGGEGPAAAGRPMLVAAPASVLPNWEAEFARWAPGLKVASYKGGPEARDEVWARTLRGGRGGGAGGGVQVLLTSYELLMGRLDKPRLARICWGYVVVDEGHRLKNAGCRLNAELRAYGAAHRLLLTGTPLQNRLEELWSLLNFLQPALFNSSDDFQEWFGGAERQGGAAAAGGAASGYDSSDDEGAAAAEAAMLSQEEALLVTNRLHQVLRPFMLRRMKEAVAGELPQKTEHLLSVPPSPYQAALFELLRRDVEGGVRGVNNVVMEMRTVCNHPLISRLHPEGAELQLPPHSLPPEVRLCSKLELLDRLLAKLRAGGHKVLLFSTMTRALDVIEDQLGWRGWPCLRLDGGTGTAERGRLVQRFNDPAGAEFVFLLSIRAGGVGLNLQAADTVIMYDTDWNPQMDLQAQARAHRLGQQHKVKVLRLVTAGSIEERVVGVASGKAQLADRSITGGFFDGKTSAAERQRYLLEAIRTSAAAAAKDAGAGAGDPLSDAALNALLARRPGEAELLDAEDARMQAGELAAWQAAASAAGAAAPAAFRRLASAEEVAPLVRQAQELLAPKKEEDEGLELGRGKRQRGAAAYRDLPEREFRRLLNEGCGDSQQPVPLLAAASPAAAPRPAHAGAAGVPPPVAPAPAPKKQQAVTARMQQAATEADLPRTRAEALARGIELPPGLGGAALRYFLLRLRAEEVKVGDSAGANSGPSAGASSGGGTATSSGEAVELRSQEQRTAPSAGDQPAAAGGLPSNRAEALAMGIEVPPGLGGAALRSFLRLRGRGAEQQQPEPQLQQGSAAPALPAVPVLPPSPDHASAAPSSAAAVAAADLPRTRAEALARGIELPPGLGGAALRSFLRRHARKQQQQQAGAGQPAAMLARSPSLELAALPATKASPATTEAQPVQGGDPAVRDERSALLRHKRRLPGEAADENCGPRQHGAVAAASPPPAKRRPLEPRQLEQQLPSSSPKPPSLLLQGTGPNQVLPAAADEPPLDFAWPHTHIHRPPKRLGGAALASYVRKQEALLDAAVGGMASRQGLMAASAQHDGSPEQRLQAAGTEQLPAAAPAASAPGQPLEPPADYEWPHTHIPRPPKCLGGAALASYVRKQEALLAAVADSADELAPSPKRHRYS